MNCSVAHFAKGYRKFAATISCACFTLIPSNGIVVIHKDTMFHDVRVDNFSQLILDLDIAPRSGLAAVALGNLHVYVWQLDTGKRVHEFSFEDPAALQRLKPVKDHEPISIKFSPNGETVGIAFLNMIHLYRTDSWMETNTLSVEGESKLRQEPALTSTRPVLKQRTTEEATAERNNPISTHDPVIKAELERLTQGDGRSRIITFEFTPDGDSIVASYCRGTCTATSVLAGRFIFPSGRDPIRRWDLRSEKIVWEFDDNSEGVTRKISIPLIGNNFIALTVRPGKCSLGAFSLSDGAPVWSKPPAACGEPPLLVSINHGQSFISNQNDEATRENKLWRQMASYDPASGAKRNNVNEKVTAAEAVAFCDSSSIASIDWQQNFLQITDPADGKTITSRYIPSHGPSVHLTILRASPSGGWIVTGNRELGIIATFHFGCSGE